MKTDVPRRKILVVDDDPAIRNLIYRFLSQSKQNYQIECAADGKNAWDIFEQFHPDLVILDVILPDAIGFKLCEEMKSRSDVLVMLLTSLTDVKSQVTGLESADAYVTKPFYVEVLEKQVQALLRRITVTVTAGLQQQALVLENLIIDSVRREVTLNNQTVLLTALEFNLLHFLASHPGKVWRRGELIREVWGYEHTGVEGEEDRVVDVHIGQIRKKIELDASQPKLIQTVRNVGYKLVVPATQTLEKSQP
ncbi:response regulator transcription factor [Planktothrix sp. FACHB-1355]|uniref:Response regulator transcription factor n=1 Tax=Aerosakkonema funiforme FACHB-1375 TaxID=2949571 RepID=A0A926ZF15_9CYAN|nr:MULTISPECIES: response regulator transcription factor [Oscillatoriales]MBD2180380.1 response regulator transcription factor [Aerosakkonema funiforme FACHB-1375]MBD3557905.1 response regulator transcription factor [Planktothrix sp. FACHB-1355]